MERLVHDSAYLEETFDRMWTLVRQANLYGGRPRNVASEESVAVARQALAIAKEADQPRFLAEANCMMAYALNANEEYVESLPFYREAIRGLEEAGEVNRAARIRLGFITALSTTGQSREALAVGQEAKRLFQEAEDYASLAKLATNLGAVYQRLDDNERAVQHHFEASELFKKIGDERALAQSYLNLGNTLCLMDRFTESEEMYSSCEAIAVRLGIDDLRSHSVYNKAYLYLLSGRFSQALLVYRDARRLFNEEGSRRHAALCDLDESEIYVQLKLPQDALRLAQAAADSFAKLDMPYEQGKAIAFGGMALTQKRQFGDALTAFREAQALVEQDGNIFWSALLDLYRSEVLFCIGRLWEAYSLAADADAKFKDLGFPAKRLVSLVLLGRVSMELGRLEDAEFHARVARELAEQAKTSLILFACYSLSAEIAEREGLLEAALESYERAAKEIELRHTHLHHDELGIAFYKGKAEVFESLAHLTLAVNDADAPARAYAWCEKAKSQMFVDALAPHLPTVRSRADDALLTRVERLRAEVNGSYFRFRPEFLAIPDLPKREEIELKEDELVRTLGELSKSDSEYVSLQTASSVGIKQLQESLPEDTSVVEYFFARDEVLAFVLTKDRFEVVRHLTPTKRVQYLAGRLQYQLKKFLSAVAQGKASDPALKVSADGLLRQFYDELVAGVVPLLTTRRLVIVPHGLLHRIPFDAFHNGEEYLSDRFDISYVPSGSVFKYCLDRPPVTDTQPLFVPAGSDSRFLRASTKAQYIRMEIPVALRQDNPVLSGLEFGDGTFCIPDIYATRWETDLLSLPFTQSAPDFTATGDDLLGLQRALLYTGCRTVLLELWRIRPEPAHAFLDRFYQEWLAGAAKREAMRIARQAMRAEYPHPFHWSPFVLVGQP
jgi:CHAT domain-containing protein/tetratricopeptide (TPR) repeat protein